MSASAGGSRGRGIRIVLAALLGVVLAASALGGAVAFIVTTPGRGDGIRPAAYGSPSPAVSSHAAATPAASVSPAPVAPSPSPDPGTPAPTTSAPRPSPSGSGVQTAADAARLQAALERSRVAGKIPGISAAVAFPDGTIWTGTSGQAIVKTGAPVTADTSFSIGSITKTFTAALVLKLAEEGRLSLDDSAARWLPDVAGLEGVTIRHLLSHRSGLDDYFDNAALGKAMAADPKHKFAPEEVLAYVRKPLFRPGASWDYSNTNYLLLGLVIERVTGDPVTTVLHDVLIDPLGLAAVRLQGGAELPSQPAAHGYTASGTRQGQPLRDVSDGTRYLPTTALATAAWTAGGLSATAEDLARWGDALYRGGVLEPASLTAMTTAGPTGTAGYAYGLGFQRIKINDQDTWGHGGRLSGFRSAMRYFPRLGITVVVLTNWDRANVDAIVRTLIRAIPAGAEPSASPASPAPEASPGASGSPAGSGGTASPAPSPTPGATARPS